MIENENLVNKTVESIFIILIFANFIKFFKINAYIFEFFLITIITVLFKKRKTNPHFLNNAYLNF